MPASGFDIYYDQDARNNFDAMRPTPVFADANQVVGQCQPIHISTNCYYGYHEAKMLPAQTETDDCDMMEVVPPARPSPLPYTPQQPHTSFPCTGRKRSATEDDHPQTKRLREEQVQTKKRNEPETNERIRLDQTHEDFLQSLFWNTHGGNIYQLLQCS